MQRLPIIGALHLGQDRPLLVDIALAGKVQHLRTTTAGAESHRFPFEAGLLQEPLRLGRVRLLIVHFAGIGPPERLAPHVSWIEPKELRVSVRRVEPFSWASDTSPPGHPALAHPSEEVLQRGSRGCSRISAGVPISAPCPP